MSKRWRTDRETFECTVSAEYHHRSEWCEHCGRNVEVAVKAESFTLNMRRTLTFSLMRKKECRFCAENPLRLSWGLTSLPIAVPASTHNFLLSSATQSYTQIFLISGKSLQGHPSHLRHLLSGGKKYASINYVSMVS